MIEPPQSKPSGGISSNPVRKARRDGRLSSPEKKNAIKLPALECVFYSNNNFSARSSSAYDIIDKHRSKSGRSGVLVVCRNCRN